MNRTRVVGFIVAWVLLVLLLTGCRLGPLAIGEPSTAQVKATAVAETRATATAEAKAEDPCKNKSISEMTKAEYDKCFATPTPTSTPIATSPAPAPVSTQASPTPVKISTVTPSPTPKRILGVDATTPPNGWTETTEPSFAGDVRHTYNHDVTVVGEVYLTWYEVIVGDKNLGKCSLRVTTQVGGERLSTTGAWRKFKWVGKQPITTANYHELVRWWIAVLEQEDRGACGHPGDYVMISWQDSSLNPGGNGRP